MNADQQQRLRSLPAVGKLLEDDRVRVWLEGTSQRLVALALQDAVEDVRRRLLADEDNVDTDAEAVLEIAEELLQRRRQPSLVRVINATGITLHTGLGRAPLCGAAVDAITEAAGAYCNLELDLHTGKRGRRPQHVAGLICELTGAEAATVVNNNAAATLLILQALAAGREVIVSRGQLVEIGGSYRLPAIMQASGATLREVGATNRTRIGDYAAAISDQTALLMRVHTSNYRIVGFTEETPIGEIAELAHRFGLLAIDDLGSGALFDLTQLGLPGEPVVRDSLSAGADLVCFSGDKLLGGPQCGVICGRRELIQQLEAHPLMRTYRVGKLTLLALEATLRHFVDTDEAAQAVPTLSMLVADSQQLAERAEALEERLLAKLPGEDFIVCSDVAYAGGGSLPADALETVVVQWRPSAGGAADITAALRSAPMPVIARVRDESIIFDVRTLSVAELDGVIAAVQHAIEVTAAR